MKSTSWCVVCLLSFLTSGVQAQAPDRGASAVPFKLAHDFLIVIPGRIGDLSGLKFILDTGSTHSTVNRKLARTLGCQLHHKQVFDFDRFVQIETAVYSEVEFGPIQLTNVSMLVSDLSRVSEFAIDADALIGSDLLSLNNFSIDYDSKKVFFGPRQGPTQSASPHPVGMILELQVEGYSLNVLVDTGVEGIVLFEDRLRTRLRQFGIAEGVKEVNVGGRLGAKQISLPEVRLGPTALNPKVLLVKGPPGDVLPGIAGYLGTMSLKARRIDFDFATGTLSWR